MTAAIANGGVMNQPSLIKGIRADNGTVEYSEITAERNKIRITGLYHSGLHIYFTVTAPLVTVEYLSVYVDRTGADIAVLAV